MGLDAAFAAKEEELESLRTKEGELESLRSHLAALESSAHVIPVHIGARASGGLGKEHSVTTGTRTTGSWGSSSASDDPGHGPNWDSCSIACGP